MSDYRGIPTDQAAAVMAIIAVVECCPRAGFSLESTLRVIEAFWHDKEPQAEPLETPTP